VVLSLEETGDEEHEEHILPTGWEQNRISIYNKPSLDAETWKQGIDWQNRIGQLVTTFQEVSVSLKTRRVFNHLVSTLHISPTPYADKTTELEQALNKASRMID
jgi:hypothetical protein